MNKDLLTILANKQFKSILQAIEYLYLAGYSLQEAYDHAITLFNPTIDIQYDIMKVTKEELTIINILNGCTITPVYKPLTYLLSGMIFYMKDNYAIFHHDLDSTVIWVDYNTDYHLTDMVGEIIKKHLFITNINPKRISG